MSVALGTGTATVSGRGTNSTFTSGNLTITGSNLAIVVSVAIKSGTVTVSSVSWSLGSGTAIKVKSVLANNNGGDDQEIWVIPAPTAGTGTIGITLSASGAAQYSGTYFTGAHQTTPCPTGDAVSSTTTVHSETLTPTNLTANDASYGAGSDNFADVSSVTPNQTLLDDTTVINMMAGYATGTTGVTLVYVQNPPADDVAKVAVRIQSAAAAIVAHGGSLLMLGLGC